MKGPDRPAKSTILSVLHVTALPANKESRKIGKCQKIFGPGIYAGG
jgi:hypothetical protein